MAFEFTQPGSNPDFLLGGPHVRFGVRRVQTLVREGSPFGQAAQFCLGRFALQVFKKEAFGKKPESAGLAPAGGPPPL